MSNIDDFDQICSGGHLAQKFGLKSSDQEQTFSAIFGEIFDKLKYFHPKIECSKENYKILY